MNIKIVLASNLDLESDVDLDRVNVGGGENGYILFSNRRSHEYRWQTKIHRLEVLISFPQVFREWLWKMHHKSLPSPRELKRMEGSGDGQDAEWAAEVRYYNDIVYCALCFAKCESPVIVLNDLSDRPIAEVLVRYINYLNSPK